MPQVWVAIYRVSDYTIHVYLFDDKPTIEDVLARLEKDKIRFRRPVLDRINIKGPEDIIELKRD